MTATLYTLHRHHDVSTVSGTGPVATICEFSSGLVAMHWDSPTPSVAVYTDIRHIEALHGHKGASTLELDDNARLVRAYKRVMPYILTAHPHLQPVQAADHPDHPDRLRLAFRDENAWRWWVALLDGSSYAATHEEINGEMQHTWITPDGDLWLQYWTPLADDNEHPLTTFDREDRG